MRSCPFLRCGLVLAVLAALLVASEGRAEGGPGPETKGWLAKLKSADENEREEAVRRLGQLARGGGQYTYVVPALIEMLGDRSPIVSQTAAITLRNIFGRPDMPDSRGAWEELWRRTKDRFEAEQNLEPRDRIKRERAKLASDKGVHFMLLGDFKTAEKYFLDAVANHPESAQYWSNLGKCLSNEGRLPDAVDRFRRALEEDPHYVAAHFNLAEAFLDVTELTGYDRTYEALGHAEVALRLDAKQRDWAARWLKARILFDMARAEVRAGVRYEMYKSAARTIAEAIHIAPNVPEVRKSAALIYYGRELYFKAYKEVVRVYDLGYTMDQDFLKKLEAALKKEAYEAGATPPEMPKAKTDARGPEEKSPALLVPYRDGTP